MFPFSDDDLLKPVERVLEKVRPTLALDGGGVSLIGVAAPKVYVRLEGACKGCASSALTLKNGIEWQMRLEIHPEIEIVNVPHGMESEWRSL